MPERYNPFEPNKPVNTYMFTGRLSEIEQMNTSMYSTLDGNPNHLLFLGERGIGKSSLLMLAKYMSEGKVSLESKTFSFLTIYISLDSKVSLLALCRKIKRSIESAYRTNQALKQVARDIWSFVKKCEISGTKYHSDSISDDTEVLDNLISSISDTVSDLITSEGSTHEGIVFLFDEVDNSSKDLQLGMMIKKLTEHLAFNDLNRVLFIITGLPCSRDILSESHPSSLRIFEEIMLKPLTSDNCRTILEKGLKKASERIETDITISDEAIESIAYRSEGYPHFIQQYAFCAYNIDTDNIIDNDDVNKSTGHAIRLIGNRYYKDLFYKKINRDSYRNVLRIMADKLDNTWISKAEIREKFKGKGSTLDNAIKALTDRNIIFRKPGAKGVYKLQWMGFALWIKYIAE